MTTRTEDAKVVGLRGANYTQPCVEASKMRDDGTFARWCIKHHHWLNDAPPCDDVLTAHLKELGIAKS